MHKKLNARNSAMHPAHINPNLQPGKRFGKRLTQTQLSNLVDENEPDPVDLITIQPRGLPADVGNKKGQLIVERKQSLTCPRGMKDEDARLLPFLPVRTASDTDNLHNLPDTTKEEANRHFIILIDPTEEQKLMNVLKTEEMIKKAQDFKATQPKPELNKQVEHIEQIKPEEEKPQKEEPESFELDSESDEDYPDHDSEHEPEYEQEHEDEKQSQPEEPLRSMSSESIPSKEEIKEDVLPAEERNPSNEEKRKSVKAIDEGVQKNASETDSSEEETSSDETSSDDDYMTHMMRSMMHGGGHGGGGHGGRGGGMMGGGGGMMGGHPYPYQYPGFPTPHGQGDSKLGPCKPKSSFIKRNQGLNFDFLPHENCCTEIELTIEPDDPDPLECAINNGIMPIVCCYMPPGLALDPNSQLGATVNKQYSNPLGRGIGNSGYKNSSVEKKSISGVTQGSSTYGYPYSQGTPIPGYTRGTSTSGILAQNQVPQPSERSYSQGSRHSYGPYEYTNTNARNMSKPFVGSEFFPGAISPTFEKSPYGSSYSGTGKPKGSQNGYSGSYNSKSYSSSYSSYSSSPRTSSGSYSSSYSSQGSHNSRLRGQSRTGSLISRKSSAGSHHAHYN